MSSYYLNYFFNCTVPPAFSSFITADFDKLSQLTPGSKIKFKEVNLKDAETIFKLYEMETNNIISKIL